MKKLESLFTLIENEGWSISEHGGNRYDFSKYSPYGQDFSISVSGETEEEIIYSIYEEYENFDVSYQTYIWLDNTGHGTNGAPDSLRDVLEDMEACEKMILDLFEFLEGVKLK